MNIGNSYRTLQSLGKAILYEKSYQNLHGKKQAVIKALAEKSGIIYSEKQPSNIVTSNETAQFVKNLLPQTDIVSVQF